MRKIFAASALAVTLALTGCASMDSGKIVDKVKETGRMEWDCDKIGKKQYCGFDTLPDSCKFQLDNGKERGWLEVDCSTIFQEYTIGEQYPR